MSTEKLAPGSLVLYKDRPARVVATGEKIQIETPSGQTLRVRPKDVRLLHPGPLRSLSDLIPQQGEVEAAWEILAGSTSTLADLAELAFGSFTPQTAWAAWMLVQEGALFRGEPDAVVAISHEERTAHEAARAALEARRREWEAFLDRVRARRLEPEDSRFLEDVVEVALGRSAHSRVLRDVGRGESPEEAHSLLLELSVWSPAVNPYPVRLGLPLKAPCGEVPPPMAGTRVDLTGMAAFAIDDDVRGVADDALSFHEGRMWVHVADPASAVQPDDPVDLEARARGAALYLPECVVPMLPPQAHDAFGLGVEPVSPALSICLDRVSDRIRAVDIRPSFIRVTRFTYDDVEARLDEQPFAALLEQAMRAAELRRERGAVTLTLPEVSVRVREGTVDIRPVLPLRSRMLVQEAMVMAGEAVARWALERNVPMPFACQELAAPIEQPSTLAAMYEARRLLRSRQYRTSPARHAGLGLDAYVQVTSPLRRYLDLVAHQQIRAVLAGRTPLDTAQLVHRIGAVEAVGGALRAAEQLSNRHWILVYLMAHPRWRGTGIIVERRGKTATVLVPDLGLETSVLLESDLPLNAPLSLGLIGVDLPRLEAHFRVLP